ncbi:hypothetical protein DFH08DRAFT_1012804 [Mycena albidolilacea]|uniref:Uncharacterized protein n=1 Tax=Mycena albidolilacea TaxID=1033008 RepID=A0AAD6ZUW5_9AGAR|nr:hypothetical protein DFH08DRAFT_1012804 [Mycena albidolilacea]
MQLGQFSAVITVEGVPPFHSSKFSSVHRPHLIVAQRPPHSASGSTARTGGAHSRIGAMRRLPPRTLSRTTGIVPVPPPHPFQCDARWICANRDRSVDAPRISAGLYRRLTAALTLLCSNLIPPHAPRLHPPHRFDGNNLRRDERKPCRTLDTLVPNVHIPPQPTPLNARAGKSPPYRPFPQLSTATLAHHQLHRFHLVRNLYRAVRRPAYPQHLPLSPSSKPSLYTVVNALVDPFHDFLIVYSYFIILVSS